MKLYEIERKFLLRPCSPKRFLDGLGIAYHRYFIQQYYLPPQEGEYLRYRRRDEAFFKTIKRGEGMVREEYEYPVNKEEFESQRRNRMGKIIEKKRYVFEYEGAIYELDRFRKSLKGLCYLEIEFDGVETAEAFVLPDIFSDLVVAEVTDDARYDNASISRSVSLPSLDTGLDRSIEPFESTASAIQAILKKLNSTLEENRKGLLEKGDKTEALHRFRVTTRKIRSVLVVFKPFFSPSWLTLHRQNLSALMAQTNAKRDVDVLLGKMDDYKSLLPKNLREFLIAVGKFLEKEKVLLDADLAMLGVSKVLCDEIATLMQPKMEMCALNDSLSQPIIITAMQILRKRVAKIIKEGRALDAKSEEMVYHHLRIEFKNLRYFIEAMKPFVESKKYEETMKLMKRMQNILGDFHDFQLQHARFVSLAEAPHLQEEKLQKAIAWLAAEAQKREVEKEALFRKEFMLFEAQKKELNRLFVFD